MENILLIKSLYVHCTTLQKCGKFHLSCCYFCFAFAKLDGTDIIKELYKRMDPTVTQPDCGDIKGDVQLSLKYNHRQQLLLVKVIRARDLVPRDLNGKSDPYVVLDLVPDL